MSTMTMPEACTCINRFDKCAACKAAGADETAPTRSARAETASASGS